MTTRCMICDHNEQGDVGEVGLAGAEGATAPESLRQKDRVAE